MNNQLNSSSSCPLNAQAQEKAESRKAISSVYGSISELQIGWDELISLSVNQFALAMTETCQQLRVNLHREDDKAMQYLTSHGMIQFPICVSARLMMCSHNCLLLEFII
jgi:hypothetical protein